MSGSVSINVAAQSVGTRGICVCFCVCVREKNLGKMYSTIVAVTNTEAVRSILPGVYISV